VSMTADAKYLHQKLSALKNVGTPSNMLETVITEKGIGPKQTPPPSNTPTHPTANQRIKGIFVRSPTIDRALPTPAQTAMLTPVTTPETRANGSTSDTNGPNSVSHAVSPALPTHTPVQEAVPTSGLSPNLVTAQPVRQEPVAASTGSKEVEQSGAESLLPPMPDGESAGIPSAGFDVLESPLSKLPPPPPPTPSTAVRTGAELGYTDPFA